jgi:serine/threonine-protein kinase
MSVSVNVFLTCLADSRLLSPQDLRTVQDSIGPLDFDRDALPLAVRLMDNRRLTEYQASVLLNGTTEGLRYGDFFCMGRLGGGETKTVYLALDHERQTLVTLKVLHRDGPHGAETRARIQREAEALTAISHPHIAAMYRLLDDDWNTVLVMEYVEGRDLEETLRLRHELPLGTGVGYIVQAARGLEYAHQRGIIHRDVKPRNVLIGQDEVVKLLDLSLARFLGDDEASEDDAQRLTRAESVVGTPTYMAPEQFTDPRQADIRSDIYGLGCTLYFALTGKPPYAGRTPLEMVKAHLMGSIPRLGDSREAPPSLQQALEKMLAKTPGERFNSTTEVIGALKPHVK